MPYVKMVNTHILWNCWHRRRTWWQNIQNSITCC